MSQNEKVVVVSTSAKPITINYDGGKVVISPMSQNKVYKSKLPGKLPDGLIVIQ